MRKSIVWLWSGLLLWNVTAFAKPATPEKNYHPPYTPLQTLKIFQEISDLIRKEYVEPVDEKTMLEGALSGLLSSLDPHSAYLKKEEYDDFRSSMKGEFGGLGMEVTMENGLVKIVAPMDDTPASKNGLKPKDLIIAVDRQAVFGKTLTEVVKKMRGQPGTDVTLLIKREGRDSFEVKLTRALIAIESVKWDWKEDVGYVRISVFDAKATTQVQKALLDFEKKNASGVVLDLRNNAGGYLDEAIGVSSLFLEKDRLIVSTRSRQEEEKYKAKGNPLLKNVPLVVLINGGSASASEIVAGALQDNKRAIILGTTSFGKGSVQQVRPLSNQGAIRLTKSRYYTPSGCAIQLRGIRPDVIIEPIEDVSVLKSAHYFPREDELPNALKAEGPSWDKNSAPPARELLSLEPVREKIKDYQLWRAVDFVKGLSVYRKNLVDAPNLIEKRR